MGHAEAFRYRCGERRHRVVVRTCRLVVGSAHVVTFAKPATPTLSRGAISLFPSATMNAVVSEVTLLG